MEAAAAKEAAKKQKRLGAFYTPPEMAAKLVRWAVREPSDLILDPSFGGLVFLREAASRLTELGAQQDDLAKQLYGVDLDESTILPTAAHSHLDSSHLLHENFFDLTPGDSLPLFSAIVGNPPYVRYQGWEGSEARALCAEAGVKLTRMASTWAPFLVHSTAFVSEGGRLAMVLPAEMLHAQYAAGVIDFLGRSFGRLQLAVFEERVFPGALEEVVLLFAEDRGQRCQAGIEIIECRRLESLSLDALDGPSSVSPAAWRGRGTLLSQLLPASTGQLYERLGELPDVAPLGQLGSVDIGAVTGANDFFLLTAKEGKRRAIAAEDLGLCISKAVHVRGARLTTNDISGLEGAGARLRLLYPVADGEDDLSDGVLKYLRRGRRLGLHRRYKCRVREPWWRVPLPKSGVPQLLLTYCTNVHPRLVLNEVGALHTNTVHSFSPGPDAPPAASLAAGFVNSLTLLSAELQGRSYGGGVLKLEPTEAESVLLPPVAALDAAVLDEVDPLLRAGQLDAALDIIDPIALGVGLGLTEDEQLALRHGAEKLRRRRHARGRTPAKAST